RFGATVMLNVLEHVRDPEAFLAHALRLLQPDGLLVIRVPNDFTPFQEAAWKATGERRRWWIARPDHINYFDFASLRSLLSALGCEVVAESSDFPMELFLLLGMDYANEPALGARCHEMRVRCEMALPPELRRRIYAALASAGVARNCMIAARRRSAK
ncbi:MAG TPA: class I SAM-dependent methyltransferase, partial [Planctomycetota bacterium]|nr:class I SAM-dependent methyltransferase [Planctomycetota bacterium]